jgi:prephenate dehydrogenase
MQIGIIGFGRFGKFLVKYLSQDFEVYVFDRNNNIKEIKKFNGIPKSLAEVCQSDIIIPAVPISEFENVLSQIKQHLRKGVVVIDVCSVKEYPSIVMKKILPKNIQILATHPMFGPDSAADSLQGRKIVLCKLRIENNLYAKIKQYLEKKGLVIIETTPKKHDKDIANSLLLTHFLGRALIEFRASDMEIDTEGYKRLMKILETVRNDNWGLFADMNKYNKYAKNMRKQFMDSFKKIEERLEK